MGHSALEEKARDVEDFLSRHFGAKGYKVVDSQNAYYIIEAGLHYVAGIMGLQPEKVEELKVSISKAACLAEALANDKIPIIYLKAIIMELPDELRGFFKRELDIADGLSIVHAPGLAPFDLSRGEVYIEFKERSPLHALVDAALTQTFGRVAQILAKEEFIDLYSRLKEVVERYVNNHPTIMGPSRN